MPWRFLPSDQGHILERASVFSAVKKYIPIIGGDFNAELGPGKGTERKSVGRYTVNEGKKRGDWLKSGLMLQDYTALNTMFRKTPQKQTTFISPKRQRKTNRLYTNKKKRLETHQRCRS